MNDNIPYINVTSEYISEMNMDTKLDTRMKPPLSSTKSIDEGFESDPDREHSTDSKQNSLVPGVTSTTTSSTTASGSFDVVQLTDRDGVHHTQISRRSTGIVPHQSQQNAYDTDNRATTVIKINPNVTIPRAGQRSSTPSIQSQTRQSVPPNTYRRSPTKMTNSIGYAGGNAIKPPRSLSAETVRMRTNVLPSNNSTQQRYLIKGNSQYYLGNGHYSPQHNSVLQNSSSLYTFYPAEGDISLVPSQYGLRYKSSHHNVEEQAPVTMWTQSIPRHSRR